jgi:hypothetical protein
MITLREVETRLAKIGCHNRFWGRSEVKELQHILMPEEEVMHAVIGRYENGFALLVATDRRILLIDKKPMFLSMEDLRYDMISEVDYTSRLIEAAISVRTINKTLKFISFRQDKLRSLTAYMQQKVMELRQHGQDFQGQLQQPQAQPTVQQLARPEPMHFADYPRAAAAPSLTANPQAMVTEQPATLFQRTNPYSATPLTIKRRVSRFYR